MKIKPGGIRQGLESQQYYIDYPVSGQVATDGIQYSAVVTVGTTSVEILNYLVDPGFQLDPKWIKFSASQRFTGLNGSMIGSCSYYWRTRTEWIDNKGAIATSRVSSWATISALNTVQVGTLTTIDTTVTGYIQSLTNKVPFRISLMAQDNARASAFTGKVSNYTVIELVGNIIPGN